MKFEKEILEALELSFPMDGVGFSKCEKIEYLISQLLEKQHEATKKACAENAKIKLYNEDLSGKEIDIYETDNYIECAKEMNSFAEISKNSILSVNMPDIS